MSQPLMSRFFLGAIALVPSLLSLTAQAQTPSSSAQCGELLNLANQTGRDLGTVFQTATSPDGIFEQIAAITTNTVATYQALAITDPELQTFQAQFVEVYTNISAASQRLHEAEVAADQVGIQTAYEEFRVAIRPERPLIQATINHCFPAEAADEEATPPTAPVE